MTNCEKTILIVVLKQAHVAQRGCREAGSGVEGLVLGFPVLKISESSGHHVRGPNSQDYSILGVHSGVPSCLGNYHIENLSLQLGTRSCV